MITSYERISELETLYREQMAVTWKLGKSNQRYRKIFDHSNDAILIIDPKNNEIIDFNVQACTMLGYSREELVRARVSDIHTRDMDKLIEFGDSILEIGHGWTDQLTCRTKSGDFLASEVSASVIDIGDGFGLIVMVRDVSQREQAKQALSVSEARYKALARENAALSDIGKAIPASADIDEVFACFSVEVGNLIQFDRLVIATVDPRRWVATIDYVFGTDISSLGQGDTIPLSSGQIGEVVSSRAGLAIHVGGDDTLVSHDPITSKLTNAGLKSFMLLPLISSDHVVGILMFGSVDYEAYTDETLQLAQRVADQIAGTVASTVTSESRLRAVLENVADGIITMNATGEIESINSKCAELFGYSADELICRPVNGLIPSGGRDHHDAALERYLNTGQTDILGRHRTLEGLRKDGTKFPIDLAVTEYNVNSTRMFTGIIRDITDQLRMESELRQSQKMEAIGRLAAGISHDFNNLLTAISGFTRLAQRKTDSDSDVGDYLSRIFYASDRAADLTKQLLMFSRREFVSAKIFDVSELMTNLYKMLERIIGEDIEISLCLEPDLPKIKIDPGQLEQIVMNLAVNARDAMSDGGQLTITTAVGKNDNLLNEATDAKLADEFVMIGVTDTGSGIDPEVQSRMFEPFFTTKVVGKGTGLGLSTCYAAVEQFGGRIEFDTQIGKGTTFRIYIPIENEVAVDESPSDVIELNPSSKETILVVEDNEMIRSIIKTILSEQGYVVLEASDGLEAVELCNDLTGSQIDLLVTDVIMPRAGGKFIADHVSERYPNAKITFITGYSDVTLDPSKFGYDFNVIRKPFTPESFLKEISTQLALSSYKETA